MNVNLGEHFEHYIAQMVKSGQYQSNSEVVREGLRLLERQHALHQQKLQNLRTAIDEGLDSLQDGARSFESEAEIDAFFGNITGGSAA